MQFFSSMKNVIFELMFWDKICGQQPLKNQLQNSIKEHRISHAQLFVGSEGSGALAMAIAYAQTILSSGNSKIAPQKLINLQHPDLHFSFPMTTTDQVKKALSKNYLADWRTFLHEQPYGTYLDWMKQIGAEKKQGLINADEADEVIKTLSLNAYEGGYKVMLIWLPELFNTSAANKLLKIIEEPPTNTIFLLVTEREDLILPTILSRCQLVKVPRLTSSDVSEFLVKQHQVLASTASELAVVSQGNIRHALGLLHHDNALYEQYFITWVRKAFMAAKTPVVLKDLLTWSTELSAWSRDEQKSFLAYCSEVFRQALLKNYATNELVSLEIKTDGFKWQGFAPFIHGANVQEILTELNEASYHIERNANSKFVLFDLSIKLTRYLHRKNA